MIPYWYKLLKCKAYGATGLTIPFLIGANEFSSDSRVNKISELLMHVSKNQYGEVMLRYCNQTRDFVLTISSNFVLAKTYYKPLIFQNLLVVPEKNLKGLDNLEHIIMSFEIDYENLIRAGKFSIVNGESQYFTEDDLDFIKKCLKVQ